MTRMWMRALLMGALVLLLGSVAGCAQERAPINQVQADALAKSFFVGPNLADASTSPEFYMRGTIIDVGYGAAQDGLFTSTYAQPLSRIRWEITENYLNARLSYEVIANSDGKGDLQSNGGLVKKNVNDGQIVASYKISTHFDIQRAYNPTTGEELNVVVENSTDRPWYQRQYFRVDWSQNLATNAYNFDTLSSLGWIGGIQYDSLAFTVLDPNDPNAPHFDTPDGYFDVTVKAFAKPAIIDLSSLGWGINTIPACQLPGDFAGGSAPYGNCDPVEITLRYSFRKVVDKDYEPVNYDGYRFQAFGIFTTDRNGYDRDYGMTDQQWFRFASRYNIWQNSHYYTDSATLSGGTPCATYATTEQPTGNPAADPNRDTDGNGTADECESVTDATSFGGSKCDIFRKTCTLPYRARTPVTIPWYINGATTDVINSLNAQIAAATDPATVANLKTQLAAASQQGQDLFEATNWAVQEWDLAMKAAIQTSRYVECKRTGGAAADCANSFPMWVGQQEDNDEAVTISRDLDYCRRTAAAGGAMNAGATAPDSATADTARTNGWTSQSCLANVTTATTNLAAQRGNPSDPSSTGMNAVIALAPVIVLCHNPVAVDDNPACGPLGLAPRQGDIRYNTVLNIAAPQVPSAWGIMVDADDPLTGEKVAASINIWTSVTDIASQSLVDLVRYANGELSTADITNGTYIDNWVMGAQLASGGSTQTMSKGQINQRIAAGAGMSTAAYTQAVQSKLAPGIAAAAQQFKVTNAMDVAIDNTVASPSAAAVNARFMAMHNSTTEAPLLNAAMMQRAGISSKIPVSSVADQASPVALNNPRVTSQFKAMREQAMASQGYCLIQEAPEMSSLTGIADAMKRKFPKGMNETAEQTSARYSSMQSYIRRRYHYAVLAHEMGHSVGLRHNFVSTYASLHYRPQYWQLRTANGAQVTPCADAVTDGSTCTGPRYFDPVTEEEQSQMIWMFMQSSVMDYPGDVSMDTLGLGAYDFAAARMFYGDTTSVYNVQTNGKLDPNYLSSAPIGQGMISTTDNFGGLTGIQYTLGTIGSAPFHYSQLQANYKLINDCKTVDAPTAPDWWRTDVDGVYDPLFDGHVVTVGGKYSKCRSLPVDYMGWNDLRMPTAAEGGGTNYRGGNAVDAATRRVRVPYSFASDNWADTGNVSVFRHDNGGDPYEQMQFLITTQEDRHILDNFRRGRTTFNVRAAGDRSYSRYNEKMYGIANGMGFLANIYKDFAAASGFSFNTLWPYIIDQNYRDNMIGATLAFDHFTRELSRPESGAHYFGLYSQTQMPLGLQDNVLRSANDSDGNAGGTVLVVPEGSTGYLGISMNQGQVGSIGFGGHLLENGLAENQGDYDVDYAWNCGSYYDKIHSAIFLSLSEDRFISQSRQDFYDARFRSVGMADIVPDGFRRIIGNALTNDRSLLATSVTANAGIPNTVNKVDPYDPTNKDALLYPKDPIGWTSWWPSEGPEACFPSNGSNVCYSYTKDFDGSDGGFKPAPTPAQGAFVQLDPQIGYEVQKFMIAWTLAYIPANQQTNWVDMMTIYKQGPNTAPAFNNRVEWQDPVSGMLYYAKSYGKECLFGPSDATTKALCEGSVTAPTGGHWVEKGIAGRVLEYANWLTSQGYACDPVVGKTFPAPYTCDPTQGSDPNSQAGFDPATGRYHFATMADGTGVVRMDPMTAPITASGASGLPNATCDTDPGVVVDCDPNQLFPTTTDTLGNVIVNPTFCGANKLRSSTTCTPLSQYDNHYVPMLAAYKEIPDYLWEVVIRYGLGNPSQLGLFP